MAQRIINVSKRSKISLPYWTALGRFVSIYAQIELVMFRVLCHYSGVSLRIGRATFSGVKTDTSMSHIRRIFEAKHQQNSSRYKHLDFLFGQLTHINKARNDILHYGANFEDDDENLFVTNVLKAHIEKGIRSFPISPDILNKMTEDCKSIIISLHFFHGGKKRKKPRENWNPPQDAWRYIHPTNQKKKVNKSPP